MIDQLHPGACNGYLGCRLCWLAVHEPEYQRFYGQTPATVAAWLAAHPDFTARHGVRPMPLVAPRSAPCVHRGYHHRLVECPTCPQKDGHSKTRVKLMTCELHVECTPTIPVGGGVKWCMECPDYRADAGPGVPAAVPFPRAR